VGGYDPDAVWPEGKANEKDDAVRCVCGSLEEDGEMTLCDTCNFWLHSECLQDVDQDTNPSFLVRNASVTLSHRKFDLTSFYLNSEVNLWFYVLLLYKYYNVPRQVQEVKAFQMREFP
ncbi:unnamed protein product, partial [Strongylus vulgaris]